MGHYKDDFGFVRNQLDVAKREIKKRPKLG